MLRPWPWNFGMGGVDKEVVVVEWDIMSGVTWRGV